MLIQLTLKSILSRKLTTILLILSISLSSLLLIGVQKIKKSAKESFSHSISGTDLIVGPRSGEIQLLLYTVFRKGNAITNMSWESVQHIKTLKKVKWVVPISLGDSHKNYPVLATTQNYFNYYKYGKKQSLIFAAGKPFNNYNHVVIGAEIARKLNYKINDKILLAHGRSQRNLQIHKEIPFKIVGILNQTGTPIDKTLHIPLTGMTAIHLKPAEKKLLQSKHLQPTIDLTPNSVTSCLVGLSSKFHIFNIKQQITNWKAEPLMAILPGAVLAQLWGSISTFDIAFYAISILVTIITFLSLLVSLFMSLQQRQKELQILRSLGAHPSQLFLLLILEATFICIVGVLCGFLLLLIIGNTFKPFLEQKMGLILSLNILSGTEVALGFAIILCGAIISSIPAYLAYQKGKSIGFYSS